MSRDSLHASRLTAADEEAVRVRIADTLELWRTSSTRRDYVPAIADREALMRLGAHAIGCALVDLRDAELRRIAELVADAVDVLAATR